MSAKKFPQQDPPQKPRKLIKEAVQKNAQSMWRRTARVAVPVGSIGGFCADVLAPLGPIMIELAIVTVLVMIVSGIVWYGIKRGQVKAALADGHIDHEEYEHIMNSGTWPTIFSFSAVASIVLLMFSGAQKVFAAEDPKKGLTGNMVPAIASIQEKIFGLEKTAARIEREVQSVGGKVDKVDSAVSKIDTKVESIDQKLDNIKAGGDNDRFTMTKLDDLELCLTVKQQKDPTGRVCYDAVQRWVAAHPEDAFQAGKMVRRRIVNSWAIPFFAQAFNEKKGDCKDLDVAEAVFGGLNLPTDPSNATIKQSMHIAFDLCFNDLKEQINNRIQADNQYGFTNACERMDKLGMLKPLRQKKCQTMVKEAQAIR